MPELKTVRIRTNYCYRLQNYRYKSKSASDDKIHMSFYSSLILKRIHVQPLYVYVSVYVYNISNFRNTFFVI